MNPIRTLLAVLALAVAAHAQTITQTFPLHAGWNAIWLKVQPANNSVATVFGALPVVSVWTYIQQGTPVQFIQDQAETQFTQPGWLGWLPPPGPVFLNSLLAVNGAQPYLIKLSSAATLSVTGEPVNRPVRWLADSFNLRGFPIDPALLPTFATYFSGTAHSGQRIHYLATNGQWQLANGTDSIHDGEACWVYSNGASSFPGTLSVDFAVSGSLDFGNVLTELTPRLHNNGSTTATITITDLGGANSPLSYQAGGGGNIVWTNPPAGYQVTIAPGDSLDLRLAIRRKDFAGDGYNSLLELKDGAGTRLLMLIKASKLPAGRDSITSPQPTTGGNLAGLWVGTASVNQVNEGNSSSPGNLTATRSPFDLKLLLHVTATGQPRLLKEVIEMWQPSIFATGTGGTRVLDKPGRLVLLTRDSLLSTFEGGVLRSGTPAGRRLSTVDYDFDGGANNFLSMTGNFAVGQSISCTIDLAPNLATNPFNSDTQRLFLLRRQYYVGDPITAPSAAIDSGTSKVYQPPAVEALGRTAATTVAASYMWSDHDQRLYFLRPMSVKVTWPTTSDLTTQNPPPPLVRNLLLDWPAHPQIHVAGAPVKADPTDPASPYRAVAVKYSATTNPYDNTTKTFIATEPGYSVIHYVLAPTVPPGTLVPDPSIYTNYFQVVKTVTWDDPAYISTQPATIGTKVNDPRGNTGSLQSGYTIFANAPYDGVGADRAYDRVTRSGPIIPVNINKGPNDRLVVAYYQPNSLTDVDWPDKPVAYSISWPSVIANPEGSGPLPTMQFLGKRIYNQPVPILAGYNPNEEHALFAPGTSGDALFALRNNLSAANTSEPYVLLKYHSPSTGEWVMRVYQVKLTDVQNRFLFFAEAGQELPPPYPLRLLPLCLDRSTVVSGSAFQDYAGKFHAKAGPASDASDQNVVINYYYKLQPGFYYDADHDGVLDDGAVNSCVPWNAVSQAGTAGVPVDVTYRIHWPDSTPALQLGETLLTAKRGLPSITNFANAQVIFDSLNPANTMPFSTSARLYDPLSARTLKLTAATGMTNTYRFPSEIALQTVGGKQIFSDLPFVIRSRLSYDPINKSRSFIGTLDSSVVGEPLLLTNVMSSNERDRTKALSSEAIFQTIVDALYDLTRNPNKVKVAPPGDMPPARALLIGYTTKYVTAAGTFYGVRPTGSILSATVVQEPLGALPKALSAGLPAGSRSASFGSALSFAPPYGVVNINPTFSTGQQPTVPLTVTAWFKLSKGYTGVGELISNTDSCIITTNAGRLFAAYYTNFGFAINYIDGGLLNDGEWHHAAYVVNSAGATFYIDGVKKGTGPWNSGPPTSFPPTTTSLGSGWQGSLDEITVWNVAPTPAEIAANRTHELFGSEPGLLSYWRFNEPAGTVVIDSATGNDGVLNGSGFSREPSTIPIPAGTEATRYLIIAENNESTLGGLPVTLHPIQVGGALFRGDLKVIFPDNVFDERLTLRHSSDFGGDPDRITFEWWYHPDTAEFVPTALPVTDASGNVTNTNGWILYRPATSGLNSITLGEGGDSSPFVIQDNWFVMRYKGYTLNGQTNWGPWVGDPSSGTQTRAALAPGWIKRVIEGTNVFEQRTKDFRQNAVKTHASLLISAGTRYEGPIALNPSGSNLNSVGLIDIYTTVLNRGESLSIDTGVDSDPANNALLLAAGRISDLYMILGNEAFADASDPTIGFDTSGQFGSGAPSLFAFQNQLDSLLDEELSLLRGRDDSAAGVGAAPVYKRLSWNFTGSDGEVAYVQNYNISDRNHDGTINEFDARIMFPQGHGDEWGHYLTALTNYYKLLRNPNFTWIPRPEPTLIAGVAVQVDYLDERKFAKAAAAKARTGSQIVDLTYRLNYVEDPNGQYQGYKDTNADRAWGVAEWARRAGQARFLIGSLPMPSFQHRIPIRTTTASKRSILRRSPSWMTSSPSTAACRSKSKRQTTA